MWAHIERHGQCEKSCAGVVRIFDDWQSYGDPYRYAFSFIMQDESTIELVGISGRAPTPEEARTGLRTVRHAGLKVMRERRSGVRQGMREIKTREG